MEEEKKRVEEERKKLAVENQALQAQIQRQTQQKREEKKAAPVILPPITSLSSLSLTFSNTAKMKSENNMIIHHGGHGGDGWETCLIGDVLRNVSLFHLFSLSTIYSSLWDLI